MQRHALEANALSTYQTILDITGVTAAIEFLTGYRIALQWGLLNTYTGLIRPLIATATGTFLYRQFFLTIPDELVEAAKKLSGWTPVRGGPAPSPQPPPARGGGVNAATATALPLPLREGVGGRRQRHP